MTTMSFSSAVALMYFNVMLMRRRGTMVTVPDLSDGDPTDFFSILDPDSHNSPLYYI